MHKNSQFVWFQEDIQEPFCDAIVIKCKSKWKCFTELWVWENNFHWQVAENLPQSIKICFKLESFLFIEM